MDPNPDGIIDTEEELYRHDRTRRDVQAGERTRRGERSTQPGDSLLPVEGATEQTPLLHDQAEAGEETTPAVGEDENWPGQKDFEGLPWYKKPSVYWMLPPFLLWTLAFGGTILPKTNLIINLMCRDYFQSLTASDPSYVGIPIDFGGGKNEQCDIPSVDKLSARFTLICGLISGLLSAVTSPKLGALSDRYGRKIIIAGTTFGMLSAEILTIFAATYPDTFNVNWFLLGFALDGLAGSFITGLAISHSYATDCTLPSRRNVAFGYFHGCLFAGIGVGPILFGLIAKYTHSLLIIFYVGLSFHVGFILCLAFVVPESLSKRRQLEAREKYAFRVGKMVPSDVPWYRHVLRKLFNLVAPLGVLWPTGPGSTPALRRNLVILAALDTIIFGVAMGVLSIIVIYTKSTFHWDVTQQATYMSTVNFVRVSSLLFVLPAITRLVRGPRAKLKVRTASGCDSLDLYTIRFSVLLETLGFLGYTLARRGEIFILAGAVTAIGGMGGPSLQSSLTKHVPAHRTGELLGAGGLLHALARIVAPMIFSGIFIRTADGFRQTVFVCLAPTFGMAAMLSWFVKPHVHVSETAFGDRPVAEEDEAQ